MIPKTDISAMYGQIDKNKPPAIASVLFAVNRLTHTEYCTLRPKYLGDGYEVVLAATVKTTHGYPWSEAVTSAAISAQVAPLWARRCESIDALFASIRQANAVTDEHRAAFARLWEAE